MRSLLLSTFTQPMSLRRPACVACFVLVVVATCASASTTRVQVDSFSCETGPYAVVLPKHYPSLHGIGRHKFTDLEALQSGASTVTIRRIEYYGLRLDVRIANSEPTAYRLLGLEVTSRRWNVGPLSVGRSPWRSIKEPLLDATILDGALELTGKTDSVVLELRAGRVDKAIYKCPFVAAR